MKTAFVLMLIMIFTGELRAQSPVAFWQQQATLEVAPGTPYPDAEKIRLIANTYADMYLTDPDAYKWAGLAALETCKIHAQFRSWFLMPAAAANADLNLLTQRTIDGSVAVYESLYWQHLTYQAEGINALENLSAEIPSDLLGAWRVIDQGLLNADFEQVWEGNTQLYRYAQAEILQPMMFNGVETAWDHFESWPPWVLSSPVPGVSNFVWDIGSIANFEDRWAWETGKILPVWRGFDGFLTAYRTEIQDNCGLVIGVDILAANSMTQLDQICLRPPKIRPRRHLCLQGTLSRICR